jgi:anaerobic selenocysteine-containing dehydrogenase
MTGIMGVKKNKINLYIPLTHACMHVILYIQGKERGKNKMKIDFKMRFDEYVKFSTKVSDIKELLEWIDFLENYKTSEWYSEWYNREYINKYNNEKQEYESIGYFEIKEYQEEQIIILKIEDDNKKIEKILNKFKELNQD